MAITVNDEKSIDRLLALLGEYEKLPWLGSGTSHFRHDPQLELRMIQAISQIAPGSQYTKHILYDKLGFIEDIQPLVVALMTDLKNEHFKGSQDELAHGEIFTDFMDMARHLLESGYKDAAAVIAGNSNEAHLRQLSLKIGLPVTDGKGSPLNGNALNTELAKAKAKAYDLNSQKLITAWQGIRNDAAHGDYSKYTRDQVQNMIDGIKFFMMANPA